MIGYPGESPRGGNLQKETDGSHGVGLKLLVTETRDDCGRVGVKSALRTVVAKGDDDVRPEAPVGEGSLEGINLDGLFLLALGRLIEKDTGLKNVKLPLGKEAHAWQEGRAGVAERIGEAETKNEAAENGEATHEHKQPKPSSLSANTSHVKNTIGQQLGRSLAELVTKVEEHDALGRLSARVPGRERPETAGNETRLGDTKQQTGGNEGAIAVLESLEGRDGAEEEELQGEPLAGADAVENHVGWDFEEHDAERQHLLTDVELILGDADILEEAVGDGVGDVSTIELQAEEAQGEQGHNDQIEP